MDHGEDGAIDGDAFPSEATIFGWIAEVVDAGHPPPGLRSRRLGDRLDRPTGSARSGSTTCTPSRSTCCAGSPPTGRSRSSAADGTTESLDCFPVPYAAPTPEAGLDVELAPYDAADPGRVAGKASLYDVTLLRLPGNFMATAGSLPEGTTPESRSVDPEGTLGDPHVIPFGGEFTQVLEPSMAAGAAAFIGVLSDYPGDSYEYYVPYDAEERRCPACGSAAATAPGCATCSPPARCGCG